MVLIASIPISSTKKWLQKNNWKLISQNKHDKFKKINTNKILILNSHRKETSSDAIKDIAKKEGIKKSHLIICIKKNKNHHIDCI